MKKYISFLLMSLVLLWTAGCSDDDAVLSSLTVDTVSSVGFEAGGGTGTITYTATGTVTATSDQSWLTLSTPSNGTVTFTVSANDDIASRTGQVILSCDGVTQTVGITQMGLFFDVDDYYEFSSEGETQTYDFYTNTTVSVSVDADWLTVTIVDGQLIITAEPNETGAARTATITFSAGWKTVTAEVVQARQSTISDYYEYFQGEWNLVYSSGSVPVTLVPNSDGTGYIMQGLAYDVAVDYDSNTHQLSIVFQYVGRYGSYYVYWCPWDSSQGYYTWSTGAGANLTFNDDEDSPALIYSDNGVWGSYTCNAFLFRAFSTTTPGSSTSVGSVATYASVQGLYR